VRKIIKARRRLIDRPAVQELADYARAISRIAKLIPQEAFEVEVSEFSLIILAMEHAMIVHVSPGQQRCSRGTAVRGRCHRSREANSLPSKDPARLGHRTKGFCSTLIVGRDDEDVRRLGTLG
jgi:hypothetical protein